jgi:hypothetical protein
MVTQVTPRPADPAYMFSHESGVDPSAFSNDPPTNTPPFPGGVLFFVE